MEAGGGDGCEMGTVVEEEGTHKSMTSIGASLAPDFSDKEEGNRMSI